MKTIIKHSVFLLMILLGVVLIGIESCNKRAEKECVCIPDASSFEGLSELPDMVPEQQIDDFIGHVVKIGYWDSSAPNVRLRRDVDTNGLPRYGRFRFRMKQDDFVLADWAFKQTLLEWGNKPNGIKDYIPLWQPPSEGYYMNVIDTVIEPETGQTGYIYRTEWVSNQEAYDEYVDLYNRQKDSLEMLYRDSFFVQELMWFPSIAYNPNYTYAIYNPNLPYHQRWTEVQYDDISKWVSGAKWKEADHVRVEEKEVYYYYVYWSCQPYFRNQISHWLAYKYITR